MNLRRRVPKLLFSDALMDFVERSSTLERDLTGTSPEGSVEVSALRVTCGSERIFKAVRRTALAPASIPRLGFGQRSTELQIACFVWNCKLAVRSGIFMFSIANVTPTNGEFLPSQGVVSG